MCLLIVKLFIPKGVGSSQNKSHSRLDGVIGGQKTYFLLLMNPAKSEFSLVLLFLEWRGRRRGEIITAREQNFQNARDD